jgi:protein-S-isoprenylcysteine O-methyltransferase Ste14
MQASDWEFKNRAMLFGMIFGFTFPLYFVDPQNATAALAKTLGEAIHGDPDRIARWLFVCAALWLAAAASIRTWSSAYLRATVVYAGDVKAESLVADGPYRRVRNPLYFANVLLASGMGAMMSRVGLVIAVAAMLVFCYRLILREEGELQAVQGARYQRYVEAVPRLWPSLLPRIASAGQRPNWAAGFKAELWYWGFPAAVLAFAISFDLRVFYAVLVLSLSAFWLGSWLVQRKRS